MGSIAPQTSPTTLFSLESFLVTLPDRQTNIFTLHRRSSAKSTSPTRPVVLLLHGYPQNHTLWYETAKYIPDEWDLVIPDLPGYGLSTKSVFPSSLDPQSHTKHSIGKDILSLVDVLYQDAPVKTPVIVIGHDRGARVAYRMAMDEMGENGGDQPRIKGLCVMDIVPITEVFENMKLERDRHKETFKSFHWIFLALPPPLPEEMIGTNPDWYFRHMLNSWTGTRHRNNLNPIAFESWITPYVAPPQTANLASHPSFQSITPATRLAGCLADYRAGASLDLDHEAEDEKKGLKLKGMEVLQLYSIHLGRRFDVEGIWKQKVHPEAGLRQVKVGDEQTGHFLPLAIADLP